MNLDLMGLGFAVSALVAATGVGGGSLMTPALVLGFGVGPAVAVGTDLLYSVLAKAGALLLHARLGRVRWEIAGWMAAGSVPVTGLALVLLGLMERHPGHLRLDTLVNLTLSLALALTAGSMLLHGRGGKRERVEAPERRGRAPLALAGAAIGALVTISSVGGGSLGVAALALICPWLGTGEVVGTDLAHSLALSLLAGLGHLYLGSVDFRLLGNLALGTVPGLYAGGRLLRLMPERAMRRALALVLLGVALRLAV